MRDTLERLAEVDRKKLLVYAGIAVVFLLLVVGSCRLVGGEKEPSVEEVVVEPVMVEESEVERRVAATVEAMEPEATATPEPTPDVAATLQADMEANREKSGRVLMMNPLDSDELRNPYLSAVEVAYLSNLGEGLWAHTKVWFLMRELLATDPLEWNHLDVEYRLAEASEYLSDEEDFRPGRSSSVGEVVKAYIDEVDRGMEGLRQKVDVLKNASQLLAGVDSGLARDLDLDDREKLAVLVRELEEGMEDFDRVMGRYGCSVCGELFRRKGG